MIVIQSRMIFINILRRCSGLVYGWMICSVGSSELRRAARARANARATIPSAAATYYSRHYLAHTRSALSAVYRLRARLPAFLLHAAYRPRISIRLRALLRAGAAPHCHHAYLSIYSSVAIHHARTLRATRAARAPRAPRCRRAFARARLLSPARAITAATLARALQPARARWRCYNLSALRYALCVCVGLQRILVMGLVWELALFVHTHLV